LYQWQLTLCLLERDSLFKDNWKQFNLDDIAASKSYTAKEAPVGSFPKYLRGSGTEGTPPEYAVFIKSAMGDQQANSEYSTNGVSSAGTASARAYLTMGSDEEDNYREGQAVLIKDATNGRSVRNVFNVDSTGNQLDLNFNLDNATPTATALGQAIHFRPQGTGHVTFSAWHYQASSGSALYQAMAGCRTTAMNINLPANGLAEINFDFTGTQIFYNPVTIGATNKYIDFTDDSGTYAAILSEKTYNNPHDLAREVSSKMNGVATDVITVSYSDTTGLFTIASDGGVTFSLLWNTGANTANTAAVPLGYATAADDTGAFTYDGDSTLSSVHATPPVTPSYDTQDSIVLKGAEIMIGAFNDNRCRPVSQASFSISTPKVDIPSMCAESGIDSSLTNSRVATFSCTMSVDEHENGLFDKMINNTTTQVMFNAGDKTGTDWVEGTIVNIYMANASITAIPLVEQDGYIVYNIEASGFVDGANKDVHINFL
jgi:hypothetical protein